MTDLTRVRVKDEDRLASPDGLHTFTYKADGVYDLPADLADVFLSEGWAVESSAADTRQPVGVTLPETEDERRVRDALASGLSRPDAEAVAAADGPEAIAELYARHPELDERNLPIGSRTVDADGDGEDVALATGAVDPDAPAGPATGADNDGDGVGEGGEGGKVVPDLGDGDGEAGPATGADHGSFDPAGAHAPLMDTQPLADTGEHEGAAPAATGADNDGDGTGDDGASTPDNAGTGTPPSVPPATASRAQLDQVARDNGLDPSGLPDKAAVRQAIADAQGVTL